MWTTKPLAYCTAMFSANERTVVGALAQRAAREAVEKTTSAQYYTLYFDSDKNVYCTRYIVVLCF